MSKSIKEIDSSIYAKKIYELKHPNKKLYKNVQNRIAQTINETFGTVYNVVCIDIDKTLTDNVQGKEFIPESIIKSFKRIISLNCYVCFITGRGKENSKSIINELIQRCVNSKSYNMSLISRWYCITNNGVDILFTKPDDKALMEHSISLLQKEVINKFRNRKKFLRDEVATIISKHIGLKKEEIVLSSENSSGDTSLRFRMPDNVDNIILTKILIEIKNKVSELSFYVSQGIYQNLKVIEIAPFSKGEAIKQLVHILGVSDDKILRIGDQGGLWGNDYSMLNCNSGFSVDSISNDLYNCFPILNWNHNYELLKGPQATALLLDSLSIYPTVTLKNPNRKKYVENISILEKKAYCESLSVKRNYVQRLSKFIKYNNNVDIDQIIDPISGAVSFFDWECNDAFSQNPNHILFKLFLPHYDPCSITFSWQNAMHTHNGLILRGPIYYFGLCNRENGKVSKTVAQIWKDSMVHFITSANKILTDEKNSVNLKEYYSRKTILGLADNIRNILLIVLNTVIQYIVDKKQANIIITLNSNGELDQNNISICYSFLKRNLNCDLSDLIEKLDKRKHIEEMLRQLKTEKRELEKLGGKI